MQQLSQPECVIATLLEMLRVLIIERCVVCNARWRLARLRCGHVVHRCCVSQHGCNACIVADMQPTLQRMRQVSQALSRAPNANADATWFIPV